MDRTVEPSSREENPSSGLGDNINLFLGWLCWIPPVAIIAAIVFLVKGSKRKAFQSIIVTIVYIPAIIVVQLIASGGGPGAAGLASILAVLVVPLVTSSIARGAGWPQENVPTLSAIGGAEEGRLACSACNTSINRFHYGFEHIAMAAPLGLQCGGCGKAWCHAHEEGNYSEPSAGKLVCVKCGGACYALEEGPASLSMVSKAKRQDRYGSFVKPPEDSGRATEA